MISNETNDYGGRRSVQDNETSVVPTNSDPSATPGVSSLAAIEEVSIYNVRTKFKRNLLLVAASLVGFILPFCDTIYLPALNDIEKDLSTTQTLVVISVSIYLFMNGIFSLLWGPISDRYGRKIATIMVLGIFVAVSIVCIFAPNIIVLIIFRALQGASISGTLVIGQGIVADIFPVINRGSATGIFFVPFLIGPVIGPLIGGGLSDVFGWRSTFICLAILSFVVFIVIILIVPETHQYFVKERFHKANPNKRIIDLESNDKPSFKAPWKPLAYLADLTILPYILMATATFSGLFICLTLFSGYLDDPPYSYSETIIGVLFVPTGIVMLIGSLLGGWLSDKSSLHFRDEICPEGRLVPAVIFSVLTPVGLLIYGWTFHYKTNLTGPIIGQVLLGFGQTVAQPGVYAYLTAKKQSEAAAASAANTALNFCIAGIGVTIAVPLRDAINTGPFFSIISGINIVVIGVAAVLLYRKIKEAKRITVQKTDPTLKPPVSYEKTTVHANGRPTTVDESSDNRTIL